ncbi:hypothetical protein CLOP_g15055 [Closterium sp. NIES-67]|nr:hypothetical protein CLOP_g15055 [Closterium sp. NIES-67]
MPKALVPDVVGSAMAARALVHVGVGEERDDRGGTSADFSCDGDKLICFGMVLEYQNPSGVKSGSRSGGCVEAANDTMPSLSAVPRSGTKSNMKTPDFR